ncbi:hypothetical protein [Croceiramulus getboli]|nr:hypothetical protein P8624_05180 [Flavobacteriaceae bacterium YJPT1-3]
MKDEICTSWKTRLQMLLLGLLLTGAALEAQVSPVRVQTDTTKIRIGEQISYTIVVQADTTDLVIFPEGQTFMPLELVESLPTDSVLLQEQAASNPMKPLRLSKLYKLTQFDSGRYTLPAQRVLINEQAFLTDSLLVEVGDVAVDTTEQGLYDIKPYIEVDGITPDYWSYLKWILPLLVVIALFLWWLVRRNQKQAEEEQQLPPFERAMVSLKALDEKKYLESDRYKEFYSELTDTIRRYLEDKVYDRSLESTTDELIVRLRMEQEAGKLELQRQTVDELARLLRTADLAKFARVNPERGKAQADRSLSERILVETKEALPEPTEEELMRDQAYREALARKRKRKFILTGIFGVFGILLTAFIILVAVKGFDFVKDNVIGHPSKELLEGTWVRSEYGNPPIIISTPEVLKRLPAQLPPEAQAQVKMNMFGYGALLDDFSIIVNNSQFPPKTELDIQQTVDATLKQLESRGVKNIIVKTEEFTTPNGAQGVRTFGTASFPVLNTGEYRSGQYEMLTFKAQNVLQQMVISWRAGDTYAEQIAERVKGSIELQKAGS